ncbi:MAG: shikimate dehydrogenase [Bacteroidaceae bacterium]|nr:shikimate dehydrogenase [Bacteroidaceae bacterium]
MGFSVIFIIAVVVIFLKAVNTALNHPHDPTLDDNASGETKTDVNEGKFEPLPPPEDDRKAKPQPSRQPDRRQGPQRPEEPKEKPLRSYDRLFGLVGKPLAHSASKVRFNKMFREKRLNAHYENFELDSIDEVKSLVSDNPNLCGFNVTIPYKEEIIPLLNRMDETASAIGAVNTVRVIHKESGTELIGYNTDWIGFTESFRGLLEGHCKALILGTGGVSKAVKYALDQLGIENRYVSRNSTFDIMGYYELSPSVMEEFDVIVNCTPLGMWPDTGQCPDIPYTFLSEKHLLLDVIANPDETLFMQKGREHGATVKGGKDMLEQQAVAAWNIWNSPEI